MRSGEVPEQAADGGQSRYACDPKAIPYPPPSPEWSQHRTMNRSHIGRPIALGVWLDVARLGDSESNVGLPSGLLQCAL
jgi:hypothetical protein